MECNEALELLSGHIDRSNTVQEETALQEHLSACPACRALLQAYEEIDRNVAALEEPAPEALAPAVMSKIAKQEKKKKLAPWLGAGAATGIAAAVLLLLVGTKALSLPKLSDVKINENALVRSSKQSVWLQEAEPIDDKEPNAEIAHHEADTAQTALSADTAADEASVRNDGFPSRELNGKKMSVPQAAALCRNLSSENNAPVLLFTGLNTDAFLQALEQLAPALTERLLPNAEDPTGEQTGVLTLTSDYSTVAALQELFRQALMTKENEQTLDTALLDELRGQCRQFGFNGSHLAKLVPSGSRITQALLTELLPEDFAEKWLTRQNWVMFLPQEDYTPADDAPAFLVLQSAENES